MTPDDESAESERRTRRGSRRNGAEAGRGSERRGADAGHGSRRNGSDTGREPQGGTEAQAKDVCLRLLTDRARSRAELADKLAAKGYTPEIAGRALDRLAEVGLIDDAAFAEQWVHSRHTYSGKGKKVLAQELRRKGIAPEDSAPALEAISGDDERTRAADLVRQKLRTLPRDLDRDKATRRLVGMLARRGYDPSTAFAVVSSELAPADFPDPPRREAPDPARSGPRSDPEAPVDDSAAELVRRKLRGMPPDLARDKKISRLVGVLARRGYPSSQAYVFVKAELAASED
ncbi:regulatory protein [Nocardia sp. GAS34]